MRRWVATVFAVALAACGTFGGVEREPEPDAAAPALEASTADVPEPPDGGAADAGDRPGVGVDGGPCQGAADCQRFVFVTSETFTGEDLGGAIAADGKCTNRAAATGTPEIKVRKFKAWISEVGFEASKRLTHGTKPYVLPDGRLLANDWNQLTQGSLFHPIDRDEANAPAPAGFVWTGSDIFGNATPTTCTGWTIGGADDKGTVGRAEAKDSTWTNSGVQSCGTGHRLFCIEE